MADKHECNQVGRIAKIEATVEANMTITAKDISNMQKQLDTLNNNFAKFIDKFDTFMLTTASKNDVIEVTKSINNFANAISEIQSLKDEIKEQKDRIKELEKFKQWLLLKIAFGSGIVTIIGLLINSWLNGKKW